MRVAEVIQGRLNKDKSICMWDKIIWKHNQPTRTALE